jgi:hypothetical protein
MTGEASQNAMTGPSGTPMASSAAMSGMTPQEQNGDKGAETRRQEDHDEGPPGEGLRDQPVGAGGLGAGGQRDRGHEIGRDAPQAVQRECDAGPALVRRGKKDHEQNCTGGEQHRVETAELAMIGRVRARVVIFPFS